jgi:hypothetical protein
VTTMAYSFNEATRTLLDPYPFTLLIVYDRALYDIIGPFQFGSTTGSKVRMTS